jgi:hypothetical protein
MWDLNFGTWISHGASHDPGPEIFLAHDFQNMDGEPGDFTVSEGHRHTLVLVITFHPDIGGWGKHTQI